MRNDVRKRRITLAGAGDHEPVLRQAYQENRRALNRRIEITVNEALISDYVGDDIPREEALSDGN